MKIAPELSAMLGDRPCECGMCARCDWQKELAALKAVARAADRLQAAGGAWDREGKLRLLRALAALAKASGGKP